MGEIGGRLIHAAFVFVVGMPVYICSHSPWWVAKCQLEMLPPLVGALGLKIFLVRLLFVWGFGHIHVLRHRGSRVAAVCQVDIPCPRDILQSACEVRVCSGAQVASKAAKVARENVE